MHGVRQTWEGDELGAPPRTLHGKAVVVDHAGGARVLLGSANVTRAALLGMARKANRAGQGNVEIALLRDTTTAKARGVIPQADLLDHVGVDFVDRPEGDDELAAAGPDRYVVEATYFAADGEVQVVLDPDAPALTFRYQDVPIFGGRTVAMRAPLTLGLARFLVVDDGTANAIVPFIIVDAHLLIPRGSRSAIGLEDFLDVLAGGREYPVREGEEFGERGSGEGAPDGELVGRTGPIPWRRYLAAVRGLGQEIERERPYERGLQCALESPVRLRGLRHHLETARTTGRLTDADLIYALYELSRELTRIFNDDAVVDGRASIESACGDLDARRAELAATARPAVTSQLKILTRRDGTR